jgi:hypothetical protein
MSKTDDQIIAVQEVTENKKKLNYSIQKHS